jgi:hypothetical protein
MKGRLAPESGNKLKSKWDEKNVKFENSGFSGIFRYFPVFTRYFLVISLYFPVFCVCEICCFLVFFCFFIIDSQIVLIIIRSLVVSSSFRSLALAGRHKRSFQRYQKPLSHHKTC